MRPSLRAVVVAACLVGLWPGWAQAGVVSLTIKDGRVTLVAREATVRQILTEWAKVGRTTIVNLDRVPGGPQTLELTNMPESQALGIILRSIGGYMAAPRAIADAGLSQFDRIVVMPVIATVAAQASPVTLPQRQTTPGPQGMRPGTFPGSEGFMGMPRRRDQGVADDQDESANEEAAAPTEEQRSIFSRPPLGMRPMGGGPPTVGDGQNASDPPSQRQMPVIPGFVTPGASVARPGVIVPAPQAPPKPPGEIR